MPSGVVLSCLFCSLWLILHAHMWVYLLQSVEAVCRGIVEQAAAAAETAQKDCASWKAKYEGALDRCNQQEFKVYCIGCCWS